MDELQKQIDAYKAANKAIVDFDKSHRSTKEALIQLGEMLKRSGWDKVELDGDDANIPLHRRIPGNFERPIAEGALNSISSPLGVSLVEIVKERRRLEQARRCAYEAIPPDVREVFR